VSPQGWAQHTHRVFPPRSSFDRSRKWLCPTKDPSSPQGVIAKIET